MNQNMPQDVYSAYTNPLYNPMPSGSTHIDYNLVYNPVTGQYSTPYMGQPSYFAPTYTHSGPYLYGVGTNPYDTYANVSLFGLGQANDDKQLAAASLLAGGVAWYMTQNKKNKVRNALIAGVGAIALMRMQNTATSSPATSTQIPGIDPGLEPEVVFNP
jgi:hypothetical protein